MRTIGAQPVWVRTTDTHPTWIRAMDAQPMWMRVMVLGSTILSYFQHLRKSIEKLCSRAILTKLCVPRHILKLTFKIFPPKLQRLEFSVYWNYWHFKINCYIFLLKVFTRLQIPVQFDSHHCSHKTYTHTYIYILFFTTVKLSISYVFFFLPFLLSCSQTLPLNSMLNVSYRSLSLSAVKTHRKICFSQDPEPPNSYSKK